MANRIPKALVQKNQQIALTVEVVSLLQPKLTPVPSPRAPKSSVSSSEDESGSSEEFTVLDSLKQMLEHQVAEIRQQIVDNEIKYNEEKAKIIEDKESEIQRKEAEISEREELLFETKERAAKLRKDGAVKDKVIREKHHEIDDLRKKIDNIKHEAMKIQGQLRRAHIQAWKQKQEQDAQHRQKSEEIAILTEDMELLKRHLTSIEEALTRSITTIAKQNKKLKILDADKEDLQAKFQENLDNLNQSMKSELDKIAEVMSQNMDEIIATREQNKKFIQTIETLTLAIQENPNGVSDMSTQLYQTHTEYTEVDNYENKNCPRNKQQNSVEQTDKTKEKSTSANSPVLKLPPINPVPSISPRESDQGFTRSNQSPYLQITPSDNNSSSAKSGHPGRSVKLNWPQESNSPRKVIPKIAKNVVSKSTTALPNNPAFNGAKSAPNERMQRTGNACLPMHMQVINTPHVANTTNRNPLTASLDGGISALKKQAPSSEVKPVDQK